MIRVKRDRKLESGIQAYADSIEPNSTFANLRERLGSWPIYAAAAGSALALSTSATADIIHNNRGTLVTVSTGKPVATATIGGNPVSLHLSHGTRSFGFGFSSEGAVFLQVNGGGIMAGNVTGGPGSQVRALGLGYPVSTRAFLQPSAGLLRQAFYSAEFCKTQNGGNFKCFSERSQRGRWFYRSAYAGVTLANGDPAWLKIRVTNSNGDVPIGAQITDWAYAVRGESISTGQISDVPEPSSLALSLLAMGSVAVLALRRMHREQAREAANRAE